MLEDEFLRKLERLIIGQARAREKLAKIAAASKQSGRAPTILIAGPQGAGKSTAVRAWCEVLNKEYEFLSGYSFSYRFWVETLRDEKKCLHLGYFRQDAASDPGNIVQLVDEMVDLRKTTTPTSAVFFEYHIDNFVAFYAKCDDHDNLEACCLEYLFNEIPSLKDTKFSHALESIVVMESLTKSDMEFFFFKNLEQEMPGISIDRNMIKRALDAFKKQGYDMANPDHRNLMTASHIGRFGDLNE